MFLESRTEPLLLDLAFALSIGEQGYAVSVVTRLESISLIAICDLHLDFPIPVVLVFSLTASVWERNAIVLPDIKKNLGF
jgi:hypothetical protein